MWQPTPKTADVTVTKIGDFFRIFGIDSFYATCDELMQLTVVVGADRGRRSNAIANDYRQEYHHGCGL